MRKINLLLLVAFLSGISMQAQTFKNGDFETGNLSNWECWQKKENKIVTGDKVHGGNYAVEVKNGMFQNFNVKSDPNAEYTITAYTSYIWGEAPLLRLEYYNPATKKLEEITRVNLKKEKNKYLPTVLKFKTPEKGWVYRLTAVPGIGKGGVFLLDDITIEKK